MASCQEENNATFSVYKLFKEFDEEQYTDDVNNGHHIILLKSKKTNDWHYSELLTDEAGPSGKIQINFGKYEFLPGPIYYTRWGDTNATLDDIEKFSHNHRFNGQQYQSYANDCHVYGRELMHFLLRTHKTPPAAMTGLHQAATPGEIF